MPAPAVPSPLDHIVMQCGIHTSLKRYSQVITNNAVQNTTYHMQYPGRNTDSTSKPMTRKINVSKQQLVIINNNTGTINIDDSTTTNCNINILKFLETIIVDHTQD